VTFMYGPYSLAEIEEAIREYCKDKKEDFKWMDGRIMTIRGRLKRLAGETGQTKFDLEEIETALHETDIPDAYLVEEYLSKKEVKSKC